MFLDFNKPPPPKPKLYDSLEEMLTELGLRERREIPATLGKAELHTSFWTSQDSRELTWYSNRSGRVHSVTHLYGVVTSERISTDEELVIIHPHSFDDPCWAKYGCFLNEATPANSPDRPF